LIHYTEGKVFLADNPVTQKVGEYPDIKAGQHLRTDEGRAEVLLTPGVFLRLSENSEIAMISNALTNTRLEVVKGGVVIEAGEVLKEHAIELLVGGSELELRKRGVFRIDASTPPRIRVYDGEISVVDKGKPLTVKEGRQVLLTSVPVPEKFSKEDTDAFYRWAGRRSGYLAAANMSAAHYMHENNIPWTTGGWYFNPYFGMFTYVPLHGRYRNAWNQTYYAPAPIYRQMPNFDSGSSGMSGAGMGSARGMSDMSGSRGYSGASASGVYQAPATAAPAGGSAPVAGPARSGGSGGSREGGGGARR